MKLNPFSPPKQRDFSPNRETCRWLGSLLYRFSISCGMFVVLGFILSDIHPLYLASVLAGAPGLVAGLLVYRQRTTGILHVSNIVCGVACLHIPTVAQLLVRVLQDILLL